MEMLPNILSPLSAQESLSFSPRPYSHQDQDGAIQALSCAVDLNMVPAATRLQPHVCAAC